MSTSKLLLAFLFIIGSSTQMLAQNGAQSLKDAAGNVTVKKDPNDTTKQTWKTGGLYNLTFNQAALSNWSAGGDKSSLSLSTLLSMYAFYTDGRRSWDNTLDLAYGMVNTTSLGTRKSDDRIDLVSKYGYDLGKKWYLTSLFNFRSQFAAGYNYPDNNTKVLTSDFLAPAYVLLSEGMDYKPNDNFSVFISPVTIREVLVHNDSLAAVGAFGVDSGKRSRFEFGAFASITWKANISKTSAYNTKLDLFSDYLHHPQNISVYWTNILAVKVTRLIAMNLSVTMIYDDNIKSVNADGSAGGPKLQLQELIGIGLAYKFDNKKESRSNQRNKRNAGHAHDANKRGRLTLMKRNGEKLEKLGKTGCLANVILPYFRHVMSSTYQIKLPQFEGPFDLLLFFIERDELDIYNIPINRIIQDFLTYVHSEHGPNIETSSEFILFVSTLMRIKARMLLPRKELDEQGNEIDPRQELIDKLLEYKRYKEAAVTLAEMEAIRHLMVRRGNLTKELSHIGEEAGEGTEIQTITLFKLMKTFEKVMLRIQQRQNRPVHTVLQYSYTMEGSRSYILDTVREGRTLSFEKIFEICDNRLHAIFLFLSMLELVQMNFMSILIGEGRNNFIIEYNPDRPADEVPVFEDEGGFGKTTTEDAPGLPGRTDGEDEPGQRTFPGFPDPSAN